MTNLDAGSALLAQATELPESWNYIVNERGQRFSTLQAAIDAAQNKTTTITLNGGDRFNSYGNVFIRGGKNVTIQAGDASVLFTNMKIDINGGSLTIVGTPKNRITLYANIETYNAAVTFKHCNIYRPFVQDRGSLKLENCNVIDLGPAIDNTSKAMIALKGNATCSLINAKVDGDIYVGRGCTVAEVDGSTIANEGYRTGNGITVEGGGTLRSVTNSTIIAAGAAIELQDGSVGPTIENSNLLGTSQCEIAVKGTASGLKIEPSLENSGRGTGFGGYYTKVSTTDPIWTSNAVPNKYQLSRWTKDVKVTTARGTTATQRMRYLVRTDCSVTYDANGGSGNMSTSNRTNQWADMGLTVASNKFTHAGANFTGWNTKADGTGKAYQPGQKLSFDSQYQVTLYAQWDIPKFTVTFDSQGGSAVASQKVNKGGKAKRPGDPTRGGYAFTGWYTDQGCTQKYDFDSTVTANKTIYAGWKAKTCTVTFQSNGGTPLDPQIIDWGQTASPYAGIVRPHYLFEAWFTDPDCTKEFDFATPITSDMTLYAKWGSYEQSHVWNEETRQATCTEDGMTILTCNEDPDHPHTESYVTRKALGHLRGNPKSENRVDPTCTADGSYDLVVRCSRDGCGQEYWRQRKTLPALGHNWGDWTTVTPASEDAEGLQKHACQRCGAEETRALPRLAHVHELKRVPADAATCSKEGTIEYWECQCGAAFFDAEGTREIKDVDDIIVPRKAHTPAPSVKEHVVESTCTEAGSHEEVVYCSVCGAEISRTPVLGSLLDHKRGTPFREDGQDATCESDGFHFNIVTCENCDQILDCDCIEDPAIGHEWDEGRISVYPTCLTPGKRTYSCVHDKKHEKTEVIPALGHTPGQPVRENVHEPDGCMDDAFHDDVVYCLTCGAELSRKHVIDGHPGHMEGTPIVSTEEPTCTEEGLTITVVECETCGNDLSYEETPIPALGHEPGEETRENEVAPTCLKSGSYDLVVRCSRDYCDEELWRSTVTMPALGHDWGEWTTVTPATEDEAGLQKRACSRCDAEETRKLPKLAHVHVLTRIPAEAATCDAAGVKEFWECECGAWFFDHEGTREVDDTADLIVEPVGHTPGAAETTDVVDATCEADGSHNEVVHCTTCGEVLSVKKIVDPAIGHDWSAWKTVKRATEEEEGLQSHKCAHCGKEETRTLPKLAHVHSLTPVPAKESTCDEEGNIAYWQCTCGAWFFDAEAKQEILDADAILTDRKDHTPDEPEVRDVVHPTCTSKGSHIEVTHCSVCGEELWRETAIEPALGHDWGEWTTVTPATEDEAGLQKRACSRCDTEETRKLPKLAHVHVLTRIPAEAATCDAAGVKEFWECDCGAWFFDHEGTREVADTADLIVEPVGHAPGAAETVDVVPATCGSEGSHNEVVRCTTCGEVLSTKKVTDPVLPHAEGDVKTDIIEDSQPTCKHEGRKVQVTYCSACGEELVRSATITPALGHEADVDGLLYENVEVETCTEAGSYDEVLYCTRCNEELFRITTVEEPLGHDWGDWETVKEPTVEAAGLAKRPCIWCDATQEKVLPEIGHTHDLGIVVAKEASCTEEGNVEFWSCADCGWMFLDAAGLQEVEDISSVIIPKTPHIRGASVHENVKEATCTEDGSHDEVVHCLNCGKTLSTTSVTDSAKGHTPSEVQREALLEATCEEGGLACQFVECTTCGEELSIQTVETEPAGHTPGDPVRENIVEPTANADGSYDKVVYCSVCGKELSREQIVLPASSVEYLVVEGKGALWDQGSPGAELGLRFVFKRSVDDDQTFSHFLGILVDGKSVAEPNYTAEPGSVIITLPPAFLETLSDGEHALTALFDDGPGAEASFTVKKLANEPEKADAKESGKTPTGEKAATKGAKSPSTGDNLPIGATAAAAIAAIALALVARKRWRKQER